MKKLNLDEKSARLLDINKLAYVGDAVYELYIREHAIEGNFTTHINQLNGRVIAYVRAEAQAIALKELMNTVGEEDLAFIKRARNHKITSKPHNVDPRVYKLATAFEAYIGYLYLSDKDELLEDVLQGAIDCIKTAALSEKIRKRK